MLGKVYKNFVKFTPFKLITVIKCNFFCGNRYIRIIEMKYQGSPVTARSVMNTDALADVPNTDALADVPNTDALADVLNNRNKCSTCETDALKP